MGRIYTSLAFVAAAFCASAFLSSCTSTVTTCEHFQPKIFVDPNDHSARERHAVQNMQGWEPGGAYGCVLPVANDTGPQRVI